MKIPSNKLLFLLSAGAGFVAFSAWKPAAHEMSGKARSEVATAAQPVLPAAPRTLMDFLQLRHPDDAGHTHAERVEALARLSTEEIAALARECARNPLMADDAGPLIWRRWAALDAHAAADFIMEAPPGEMLSTAADAVMAQLAVQDPERAMRLHRELDPELRGGAAEALLEKLAEVHPAEAVRRLEEFGFREQYVKQSAVAAIAEKFAENNPGEALEWALSLAEETERAWALARAVQVICLENPEKAVALLRSIPPESQRELTLPLAEAWAGKDPAAALAWAKSLTDAGNREYAWVGLIREQPDKAGELLMQIADVSEREAARYRLLAGDRQSHFVDDATAAKLLREAAPGMDVDRQTEKAITYRFRSSHPEVLLEWAIGLPGDDVAEKAAADALNTLAQRKQTAEAGARIAAVADPDRRRLLQRELAEQWSHRDRAAAAAWVDTLPPEERREAEVKLNEHSGTFETREASDFDDSFQ